MAADGLKILGTNSKQNVLIIIPNFTQCNNTVNTPKLYLVKNKSLCQREIDINMYYYNMIQISVTFSIL